MSRRRFPCLGLVLALTASSLAASAVAQGGEPAGASTGGGFAPPPACRYARTVLGGDPLHDHADLLLDTEFGLPPTPDPPDLVSVRASGFDSDHLVREIVLSDLSALKRDARAAGLALDVRSAYRSFTYQEQVFAYWVSRLGEAQALRVSARPGHSEHQLGTAVDFGSRGGPAPWDEEDWGRSQEGAWLAENAYRYGFLLSYPAGEEERTCYDYEPWHFRWVGRDRASAVQAEGVPLRVWLWRHMPPR